MTAVPLDKRTTAVPASDVDRAVANTLAHIAEDHTAHVTPPPAPLLEDATLPNRGGS